MTVETSARAELRDDGICLTVRALADFVRMRLTRAQAFDLADDLIKAAEAEMARSA